MKRTLLIAFFFGACSFAFAQNQNQSDEVATLKKQVVALKQTNARLGQRVTELNRIAKNLQDSLAGALKGYDLKLNAMEDSLKSSATLIQATKSHYGLVDHSLKTRKTVFYIAFIVAIILLIVSYLFLMKKFKTANEQNEVRVFNLKDTLEVEVNKTKSDLQAQLASARDELEKKIKEAKK